MHFVLLASLLVPAARAGDCAVDTDGDGYAGATVVPDGDGDCSDVGELPVDEAGEDCDDASAAVHPGAEEAVGDLVDDDCDGIVACYADRDGDGWRLATADPGWDPDLDCDGSGEAEATFPEGDCDDGDPDTWPGAPEIPGDDFDEDCDGTELCYRDSDGDGHRTDETFASADADCDDEGEAHPELLAGDCNDDDAEMQQDCPPAGAALTGSSCAAAGASGGPPGGSGGVGLLAFAAALLAWRERRRARHAEPRC